MTHSPDAGHERVSTGASYADEFALLDDRPSHAELAALRAKLARAEAERDAARSGSRALAAENEVLHAALADVIDLVMRGADDPITGALDALENAGIAVFDVADSSTRQLLAVAA